MAPGCRISEGTRLQGCAVPTLHLPDSQSQCSLHLCTLGPRFPHPGPGAAFSMESGSQHMSCKRTWEEGVPGYVLAACWALLYLCSGFVFLNTHKMQGASAPQRGGSCNRVRYDHVAPGHSG